MKLCCGQKWDLRGYSAHVAEKHPDVDAELGRNPMTPTPDAKPITEAELKEMEVRTRWIRIYSVDVSAEWQRLIAEVRRLREALEHYGTEALWDYQSGDSAENWKDTFRPLRPDLSEEPGYKLARLALGWQYPPPQPCANPKCDGVEDGTQHRCFKDGRWLDDGSEM